MDRENKLLSEIENRCSWNMIEQDKEKKIRIRRRPRTKNLLTFPFMRFSLFNLSRHTHTHTRTHTRSRTQVVFNIEQYRIDRWIRTEDSVVLVCNPNHLRSRISSNCTTRYSWVLRNYLRMSDEFALEEHGPMNPCNACDSLNERPVTSFARWRDRIVLPVVLVRSEERRVGKEC